MKFILDKSTWLRGEMTWNHVDSATIRNTSQLLREDGKMCCLGQLAEQCGVPREKLLDKPYPSALGSELPEAMTWTRTEDAAVEVAVTNDNSSTDDNQKIARLRPIFAKHGIELEVIEGTNQETP